MSRPANAWSLARDPWSALVAALGLALAAMQPLSSQDTFGHLAQGRVIAELGWPPALDPFSFWRETPQPWVNYEWLSDWLTWGLYARLGDDGLVLVSMALVAIAAVCVVHVSGRLGGRSAAWITALLTLACIPAVRHRLSARPHLIGLVLGALYLVVATRPEAAGPTLRRAAPCLAFFALAQIAWVNLHGSHLLGTGIVGCALLASVTERSAIPARAAALVLTILGSCVSPWGAAIVLEAIHHVFDGRYRAAVEEWHPLLESPSHFAPAYAGIVLAVSVALGVGALRAEPERRILGLVAIGLGLMAFRSGRFVLEMLVLGAPFVGIELARGARTAALMERLDAPRARAALVVLLGVAAALGASHTNGLLLVGLGTDRRELPFDAGAYIERDLPGARVLASMQTSWFLLFVAPHARVLVDGRVPFYGPDHANLTGDAMARQDALWPLVRRFRVDTIVVQHTAPLDTGATGALAASPLFVRAWIDASYAVYVRRGSALAARVDEARFDALPGSYDPAAVLGAPEDRIDAIRQDTLHLDPAPAGAAFAAFVRAMLRVRPLAREAGWSGYRAPRIEERGALDTARLELARTRAEVGSLPVLRAHEALLATLACDLDGAEEALAAATVEADSRETLFGAMELAVRRGDHATVRAFLAQASRMPGAAGDGWVAALTRELDEPSLRCP